MSKKYVSTRAAFVGEHLYNPGEVFALPPGLAPSAAMREVKSDPPAPEVKGPPEPVALSQLSRTLKLSKHDKDLA